MRAWNRKFQFPNSKLQANSKLQLPNLFWSFFVWSLVGIWYLGFGVSAAPQQQTHRFEYQSNPDNLPRSVHVAGSFNSWSTTATPMQHAGGGLYFAEVPLAQGVHHYKFVINGDQWVNDPKSDRELEEPDGYGGVNSAVLIGPDIRQAPPPQPNHVNLEFVAHDADSSPDGRLRLRVRAQAGDVEKVIADVVGANPAKLHHMTTERGFDIFGGLVWPNEMRGRSFTFRLIDGSETVSYNNFPAHRSGYFVAPDPVIDTPEWAQHAVWYQIFPERFRNGDPSNDPGNHWYENLIPWTADWWQTHVEHGEGQCAIGDELALRHEDDACDGKDEDESKRKKSIDSAAGDAVLARAGRVPRYRAARASCLKSARRASSNP
jgi:cyclomaltodextrinase / maltogenic alpha-amylase / neopullulanase